MSESRQPTDPPAPAGAAAGTRYSRTTGGLVGAMIVTVLAVLAFVAFRAMTLDQEPTPIRAVDYATTVASARADKQLLVMAPEQLPPGWTATSATYDRGASPAWHLGTLTGERKYVGVEEGRTSIEDLAHEHVDVDARRGKDVTIGGETWQTWTDPGGDYAVARSVTAEGRTVESWLVVGTAPQAQIRGYAGSLVGGTPRVGG